MNNDSRSEVTNTFSLYDFVVVLVCCMNNDSKSEVMNTFSLFLLYFLLFILLFIIYYCCCFVALFVLMFLVFSLDDWCVFYLVLLHFPLMVVIMFVLFGCIVLVIRPFCIGYWLFTTRDVGVVCFWCFVWCLVCG